MVAWALTTGPQSFYWGGTWICGANGTDNKSLVKDIIEKMTTDESVLKDIVSKDNDYANNSKLMDSLKDDKSFGDKALGGQKSNSDLLRRCWQHRHEQYIFI